MSDLRSPLKYDVTDTTGDYSSASPHRAITRILSISKAEYSERVHRIAANTTLALTHQNLRDGVLYPQAVAISLLKDSGTYLGGSRAGAAAEEWMISKGGWFFAEVEPGLLTHVLLANKAAEEVAVRVLIFGSNEQTGATKTDLASYSGS